MKVFFSDEEYNVRLAKVRHIMAERNFDMCLVSVPENVFYLTGLSHQGYFTYHMLLLPIEDDLTLITREMERPTIEAQVNNATFIGYADSANPAQITAEILVKRGFAKAQIGLEQNSMLLTSQLANDLQARLPDAHWHDASGIVNTVREVKSEAELDYIRKAISVSSAMMQSALDVAKAGISEREIAAEIYRTMVLSGGDYPGFHPFVRSTPTLSYEHITWSDRVLEADDMLFLEFAGCVHHYHAPMGRLVYVDHAPQEAYTIEKVCLNAFEAVTARMTPGTKFSEIYQTWQDVVDSAGLAHYRRHHCGYVVGIGFPPSWTGGNQVIGLRHDSDKVIEAGMVFHTMSWLMYSGAGNYFVSDTALVTDKGTEVLTNIPRQLQIV